MESYTKEQLIAAFTKYNTEYLKNPTEFVKLETMPPDKSAKEQVEYIIELIEADKQ